MPERDDYSSLEEFDELMRQFSSTSRIEDDRDLRFIDDLQRACHDNGAAEDMRSLQRSWERIMSAQQPTEYSNEKRKVIPMSIVTKEAKRTSPRRTFSQRFGVFIAVAVAMCVIASMVLTFTWMHNSNKANMNVLSKPPISSTPTSPGKQGDTITSYQQEGFSVYSVRWSPDGKRIASTGESFASWDALTGKNSVTYLTLPNPIDLVKQGKKKNEIDWFYPAAQWSPDSSKIALPFHSNIQIWDSNTNTLIKTVKYPQSMPGQPELSIRFVHWSADGKDISAITTGEGRPNVLTVFDVATGEKKAEIKLALLGTFNQVVWSPDNNYLAVVYFDKSLVYVLNLHTGQISYTYNGPATVGSVAWSPDSRRIATGFGDGKDITQVWDALTGRNVVTHNGGTLSVWSPDGKYIAMEYMDPNGKEANGQVQVWQVTTGKTIYTYEHSQGIIFTLDWSPNSKYIVSAGMNGDDKKTAEVLVWRAIP
ncbi:hypothetical protein KDA_51010 [Dictyobacter alpinus]|uniref:Translation initiation factor beta propellor-like domain-containing protein n=1 Tax=Dictyobacter alpinus TaxID=2014873 RepID=A0A402BED6_9CHLR|nr:PD40 domain-containing protein [Dictyobacter alpinus]GCE29617.1 hypothetical protein KDA_51010 [Dictyobacter alpinus]